MPCTLDNGAYIIFSTFGHQLVLLFEEDIHISQYTLYKSVWKTSQYSWLVTSSQKQHDSLKLQGLLESSGEDQIVMPEQCRIHLAFLKEPYLFWMVFKIVIYVPVINKQNLFYVRFSKGNRRRDG